MKKKTHKNSNTGNPSLEAQAWSAEPPRSSRRLSRDELFVRSALTWGREWIRRHHEKASFSTHSPVAIVLSDGLVLEDDPLISTMSRVTRALGAYAYPLSENVFIATPNAKRSVAVAITVSGVDDLITTLHDGGFGARALIVIDPAGSAIGAHSPPCDLMEITTAQVPVGDEPPLSIAYLDKVLARHHKASVRLPKKWVNSSLWSDPADEENYDTVEQPEHVVHVSLWQWMLAVFDEHRIYTDYEVQAASGRADIRISEAAAGQLWFIWLELKVLRESMGPALRKKSTIECISQARARHSERPTCTRALFACCYDASKKQEEFGDDMMGMASGVPVVELRRYEVLRKLYQVGPAPS
jgi:hypothetical protein